MHKPFLLAAFCGLQLAAQTSGASADASPWRKLDFLLGNWTGTAGEKDTQLGAGRGGFSFEQQLDRKVIIRRNHAEYDSGVRHDDLMVIYRDAPNDAPRAVYFDSEGHVIRYNLMFPSSEAVVMESDSTQPGPKYRLSYRMEKGKLNGKFEVAPPGSGYQTYMQWTSSRN